MITDSKRSGSNKFAGWLLFATTVAFFVCCSWVIITHKPQPSIPSDLRTVTEFSPCKGLDENRNPVEASTTFSSDEKQIFVCGYLQTNQPITLSVYWYYEDEFLFRDLVDNVQGRFVSQLKRPTGSFREGIYEIQLVITRAVVWRTKFRIEHS